jgi:hypothetical protein
MQAFYRIGLLSILLVGVQFFTPKVHAGPDSTVVAASSAIVDLDCVIFDDEGNPVCVKVINSGPGNTAYVAVGICGGIDQYVGVPAGTTRRVASPCYFDDFFWIVTPSVPWALVDDCDQLQAKQFPC